VKKSMVMCFQLFLEIEKGRNLLLRARWFRLFCWQCGHSLMYSVMYFFMLLYQYLVLIALWVLAMPLWPAEGALCKSCKMVVQEVLSGTPLLNKTSLRMRSHEFHLVFSWPRVEGDEALDKVFILADGESGIYLMVSSLRKGISYYIFTS
jgi:hypothetical protein